MASNAYVTLSLSIDLDQARDLGIDVSESEEVEYAKEEFLEYLDVISREDIFSNLEVELE